MNNQKIPETKRSFIIPVLDMSPASPYNIEKLLDDLKEIEGDIIIIFNSLEMAEKLKDHPRIDYYAIMKENVGVSRAWNIGLNIAHTPVSFIMNSDLHVEKDSIEKIEKYLLELPDAAIAGPQGSFFNFNTMRDIAYFDKGSFDKPFAVDAVSGFFFAVKTELFNTGTIKFDNQYTPCYCEEWDIGLQCKMAGLKTYVIPVTGYAHEWSGSIRALKTVCYLKKEETLGVIHDRNRKSFVEKWKGIAQLNHNVDNLLVSLWADIMVLYSETLIKENKIDDAIKILNKVIEEYPENINILTKTALIYYNNNQLEKALEYFSMIEKINPDFQFSSDLLDDAGSLNNQRQSGVEELHQSSNYSKLMSEKQTEYYENPRPDIQQIIGRNLKRILDVGCGSGKMALDLKNNLNAEVWGIEPNYDAAQIAMGRLDRVICSNVEDAIAELPDNYFDRIVFADVLEHLVNPFYVLEKIKNKLSVNGEIIASIPNVRYWPVVRHLLEGHWTYQDSGILDFTHLRFFTLESIGELFGKSGYLITGVQGNVVPIAEIPDEILQLLNSNGLDVKTLKNESKFFQFLVSAKRN